MLQLFSRELNVLDIVRALAIMVVFGALVILLHVILVRGLRRLTRKSKTELDDAILAAIEKPLVAILIVGGFSVSAGSLPLAYTVGVYVTLGASILLSLLGILTVLSLIDALARWSVRALVARTEAAVTQRVLWVSRIAIWIVAVMAATGAVLSILGMRATPITGWLGAHGWRIALIIVLSMVITVAAARMIPRVMQNTVAKRAGQPDEEASKRAETLSRVLINLAQAVVLILAIFMVLSELEIEIAPILTALGVAGVAIGFGAQSLIRDLIAGLFVIIEGQYRVGDVVNIADKGGLVEDINLRRTVLRDLDGTVHFVPNGEIRVASNLTKEWSRVNMNISVAYGEDLERVIPIVNRIGKELAEDPAWAPLILKPPQVLRVDKLGDSGVEIKILGDTKPIRQWDVMGEMRRRLKNAFDREGIEIPFPHTKVYFGDEARVVLGGGRPGAGSPASAEPPREGGGA